MGIESNQRWVRLPQSGFALQSQKGQPHHSHSARELCRNLNYAIQHRLTSCIVTDCSHTADDGEGIQNPITTNWEYKSNRIWAGGTLASPRVAHRGRIPVWEPHASNLTVAYAIRAEGGSSPGKTPTIEIFVCDTAWDGTSPPGSCNYVKESITVLLPSGATNSYRSGGTGQANGEYTGTITVNFPPSLDNMYYIYVRIINILVIGGITTWVDGGTP